MILDCNPAAADDDDADDYDKNVKKKEDYEHNNVADDVDGNEDEGD